jgi:hypothetical protein
VKTETPNKCAAMCDVPHTNWQTGQLTWSKESCGGNAMPGSKYCPWHQDRENERLERQAKIVAAMPNEKS